MNKIVCPYCGSENVVTTSDRPTISGEYVDGFECLDCHCLFDEEDIERENLRHEISHILIDTDEDNQFPISMPLYEDEPDTFGLSSLVLPWIESVYQIPGDGTIWFKMDDTTLETGDNRYMNFDDITIRDLQKILVELQGLAR